MVIFFQPASFTLINTEWLIPDESTSKQDFCSKLSFIKETATEYCIQLVHSIGHQKKKVYQLKQEREHFQLDNRMLCIASLKFSKYA